MLKLVLLEKVSGLMFFFVDFRGHKDDPAIIKVLAEVSQIVMDLRVLGSYPKAVL